MTTAFAYLRRQLYVLDTYPNAAVKRLNHTMLFLYSYASLGIFVPLFVIVFYVIQVSLYVTRALSPTTTGIADAFPRISTYALLRLAISYARALEEWQIDRCMPLYTHTSYAPPASSPTRVTDTHTHTHTIAIAHSMMALPHCITRVRLYAHRSSLSYFMRRLRWSRRVPSRGCGKFSVASIHDV